MNGGKGAEQFLVITDLESEHLRNLITMHVGREANKKRAIPIYEFWKESGTEGIQGPFKGGMKLVKEELDTHTPSLKGSSSVSF